MEKALGPLNRRMRKKWFDDNVYKKFKAKTKLGRNLVRNKDAQSFEEYATKYFKRRIEEWIGECMMEIEGIAKSELPIQKFVIDKKKWITHFEKLYRGKEIVEETDEDLTDSRDMEVEEPTRLVKMTIDESTAKVVSIEGTTDEIKIENYVRQSEALLAILFNMVLEGIIRTTEISKIIIQITLHVAYADNIVLVAKDIKTLAKCIKNYYKRGIH